MTARQIAFLTIREIEQKQGYTDVVLARYLNKNSYLSKLDKNLINQLVYGTVRHKRTLNSLINQLAQKKARQQPLNLRIILQLGLYQLCYLDKIPPSAVVNTSVELAKQNGLKKLAGVVNGILRNYLRQSQEGKEVLQLPSELIPKLGVKYSFPDWIVKTFLAQLPSAEVESLLTWYNQPSPLDVRVNKLRITRQELQARWEEQGINAVKLDYVADGLRLTKNVGDITKLFGFEQGYFTIQAGSTQLVSYILNPQPHEIIIDACAAPGGKTTHIAELMGNEGKIWACDYLASRLVKVKENAQRLGITNIETVTA